MWALAFTSLPMKSDPVKVILIGMRPVSLTNGTDTVRSLSMHPWDTPYFIPDSASLWTTNLYWFNYNKKKSAVCCFHQSTYCVHILSWYCVAFIVKICVSRIGLCCRTNLVFMNKLTGSLSRMISSILFALMAIMTNDALPLLLKMVLLFVISQNRHVVFSKHYSEACLNHLKGHFVVLS